MQKTLQIGKTKWIFIQEPNKETIDKLAQEYGFHEMIVEDILGVNTQSKIDTTGKYVFVALTFTKYTPEEARYHSNELDVIIGDDLIVTTLGVASEKFNEIFEDILKESNHTTPAYKTSPYYILYRIIDGFYDKTLRSLAMSGQKLFALQDNINSKGENVIDDLINEDLNKIFIKHNFLSQEEIIDDLTKHISQLHEKHLTTYFTDLQAKLAKINRTINILMEKNDSLLAAYNTFVGIKSSKSVTRLTVINSIFLPLTLLAGIGGMSEWSMMTGAHNWRIAYPLFLILCVGLGYVTFQIIRRISFK